MHDHGLRAVVTRHRLRASLCMLLLWLAASATAAAPPSYRVDYRVGFVPASGEATVTITIAPGSGRAQRLRFSIDPERHLGFEGDGAIERSDGRLTWRPPKAGGELRYRYRVEQARDGGTYVARMTEQWTLLRIDRLIPPVAVLAPNGAVSRATLRFDLPKGWPTVDVGYVYDRELQRFPIENPGRLFQRPLGWMIAGDIGNRRERIDGFEVSVAAPRGSAVRRNDLLAIVNSTAFEMRNAFGGLPPKLLIVAAGDPMWRGGLSGPNSLYMHADRPLISENGTSTLVHEMVHVITGIRGSIDHNWIAEGVAEFYSIELLRRSGLISDTRAERAFSWMENHGRKVKRLRASNSQGPRTARAVVTFKALDDEIRAATDQQRDLDDVVRRLMGRGRISPAMLRAAATEVIGRAPRSLPSALID
jgi:hypothetical protein